MASVAGAVEANAKRDAWADELLEPHVVARGRGVFLLL